MKNRFHSTKLYLLSATIVVITVLLSYLTPMVRAEDKDVYKKDGAYDFAIEALSKYYFAVDQYMETNTKQYISDENVREYISRKIEAKNYAQYMHGTDDKRDYKVTFALKNAEERGNNTKLYIASKVEFRYKGLSEDSGYGELNVITIKKEGNVYSIIGWYCPKSDYDGDISEDWEQSDKWTNEEWKRILEKQREINNRIKEYYSKGVQIPEKDNVQTLNKPNNNRTLNALNRMNIVSWANTNCDKASPASGNASITTYYDFSQIPNNYDCTNFVSHAILAGGSVMYNTAGGSGGNPSPTGWYYVSLTERSSSWSGVPFLYDFLTTNTTQGPTGQYMAYSIIYLVSGNIIYQLGDILQFQNSNGVWRHSTVVTGYGMISGSITSVEALVTGRTDDSTYNKNQRASEIYVGTERRVIELLGYYS